MKIHINDGYGRAFCNRKYTEGLLQATDVRLYERKEICGKCLEHLKPKAKTYVPEANYWEDPTELTLFADGDLKDLLNGNGEVL